MTWRRGGLVLITCFVLPMNLFAQPKPEDPVGGDLDGARKGGTYLKLGLAHWQGDIFSRSSLTHWDVDLFGAAYNLTSLNVEFETYFSRTLLALSGFSIGYRKDAVRHVDSGHMLSGSLFRDVDLRAIALKAGGGIEWGMPSLNFDRTEFEFLGDEAVRYRHTYPDRNADVPLVGTTSDGALYPFVELSAVQRPWNFLVEAGIRINIMRFHFDDYEVSASDEVTHVFSRKNVLVPYLFANFGFRLF